MSSAGPPVRENRRRYGSRRVQKALQEQGVEVGRHQVRRLMKRQNWQAIQPRSFVPRTTDSSHGLRACPNLLLELGLPVRPDQAWVSDITYLPLVGGGWAYLASWLDLYSRRIVGWCVDVTMEESLIIRAFDQATTLRRPQPGLIAHSDQGGQYFGKTFRARLDKWNGAARAVSTEYGRERKPLPKRSCRVFMEPIKGRTSGGWVL